MSAVQGPATALRSTMDAVTQSRPLSFVRDIELGPQHLTTSHGRGKIFLPRLTLSRCCGIVLDVFSNVASWVHVLWFQNMFLSLTT